MLKSLFPKKATPEQNLFLSQIQNEINKGNFKFWTSRDNLMYQIEINNFNGKPKCTLVVTFNKTTDVLGFFNKYFYEFNAWFDMGNFWRSDNILSINHLITSDVLKTVRQAYKSHEATVKSKLKVEAEERSKIKEEPSNHQKMISQILNQNSTVEQSKFEAVPKTAPPQFVEQELSSSNVVYLDFTQKRKSS